jgi:hypothetical protein
LQADVTILQQINGSPLQIVWRGIAHDCRSATPMPTLYGRRIEDVKSRAFRRRPIRRQVAFKPRRAQDLPSAAIRCARRETLRCAALRCTTFFCAARMMTGSASAMAASARDRSPAVIASSTLRTAPRSRERRALLTIVRRTLWRAAFLADFVLAMFVWGFVKGRL